MNRFLQAVFALSFVFPLLSPIAQPPDQFSESLRTGLKWRSIGPYRGGRVLAVTGVPSDPNIFDFGGVAGGVWRTTNAGLSWTPLFDKQPIASIGAIAELIQIPTSSMWAQGRPAFAATFPMGTECIKVRMGAGLGSTSV